MVIIEKKYILSENDKSLSFVVTNELEEEVYDVDAVIYTDAQNDVCLKMLADVCNIDGIIPINFKNLYGVFHNSGKWYFNEYTCTLDHINNSDLYTDYNNIKACFIVFKMCKKIDGYILEDILENIKQGREEVDITFGCILDETIEPDRIDLFVYKS